MSSSYPAMNSANNFSGDDAGDDSTRGMATGNKIIAVVILFFFVVSLFFVVLQIYARWFFWSRGSFRRRRVAFLAEQDPLRLQSVGLGKSAIEAIPVFIYQSENHEDGLECAVCLCEFQENEKARLLPKCHHNFHIECIDMWFHSHSTCLLCRASAQLDPTADSVVVVVEKPASGSATEQQVPAISEGNASISMETDIDSDIDLCRSFRHHEVLPSPTSSTNMLFRATQNKVSSVSNFAFFDQGTRSTTPKTLDKINIDIPQRLDSFSSSRLFYSDDQQVFSPSGQSLKSPGIRLHQLKGLLSKEKRVVPQSPNNGTNIHIEQGGLSQSRE